jgi:NAD(P)H-dependent FMN reductase
MKKILAIAGSNSKSSINRQLVHYAADKLEDVDISLLDMNDFELPIYSPDVEKESGIPQSAHTFMELIINADAVILSLAEYNGLHAAAFKNLWDWASRIQMNIWADTPMLLMAASPGGRGGMNVLRVSKELFPHFGGNIVADFSMPNFYDNFANGKITNPDLEAQLLTAVNQLNESITNN